MSKYRRKPKQPLEIVNRRQYRQKNRHRLVLQPWAGDEVMIQVLASHYGYDVMLDRNEVIETIAWLTDWLARNPPIRSYTDE